MAYSPYEAHHELFGNKLPVYFDPFPKIAVVGRGVQTGLQSVVLQCSRDHVRRTSLSVGTPDVDTPKFLFRIAQPRQQASGIAQVLFVSYRPFALVHW